MIRKCGGMSSTPLPVVVSQPTEALKMALPQKMRSDLNANCFHSDLASARCE
jgi:hypothetical protein